MTTRKKKSVKSVVKRKRTMPAFRSDEEERAYWAKQSIEKFADVLEDLDVEVHPARTEQIAVRLYKEDLDALRRVASEKGVGHTTLARTVLEQWLEKVRGTVDADSNARRTHRRREHARVAGTRR